jgi:uncharacterized protein (TIGR02147 family)
MSAYLDIFQYFDYRLYLGAYYEARKAADPYFSHRSFARKAGHASPALYGLVVQGLRRLTPKTLPGFSKALGHGAREAEYFQLMMEFTHAASDQGRQEIFGRMVPYLPARQQRLRLQHREFYSHWSHVVVHQALSVLDIGEDLQLLQKFIEPTLGLRELKKSMQLLQELMLIAPDARGYWKPTEGNVVGGSEVGALYIHNFQNSMLDLGKDVHERWPTRDRYQVTESYAVSLDTSRKIRKRLEEVHREIVEMITQDCNPEDRVWQWNLQLFPMSRDRAQMEEAGHD